jgi:hypothetical protein
MIDEIGETDTSIPREVSGFGDGLEVGKESEHYHITELKVHSHYSEYYHITHTTYWRSLLTSCLGLLGTTTHRDGGTPTR